MSETLTGHLERAREAFERHAYEEVLQHLLKAWKIAPAECIARLAEQLSEVAAAGLSAYHRHFSQVRQFEALVKEAGPEDTRSVALAVDELLGEPPDPRFTPALLDLAARPVFHEEPRLGRRVCNALGHVKDPRAIGPLRALSASLSPETPIKDRLELTLDFLTRQPVPVLDSTASVHAEALEAALARRAETRAPRPQLFDELYDCVVANLDDDGPRLVLTDHLLELGEGVGELMMHQLQRAPDVSRHIALDRQYAARWTDLLEPRPMIANLWRGLPYFVVLQVQSGERLPPPGRFWLTVQQIRWSWRGDKHLADWLTHPNLRNVTVLDAVPYALAVGLGMHPLPVRQLETFLDEGAEAAPLHTSLAALPRLSWLILNGASPEVVRQYATSALGRRLERFSAGQRLLWWLDVQPSAEVPVMAALEWQLSERGCQELAEAIRVAAHWSTRALRIRSPEPLDTASRRLLEVSASAYERVEWDLPPG
ncbi:MULTISPECIES: hypothetical protein [Myxococcus]|uniref:hypothetical protein n=1 Tax=Myxococcus TaxID=32 RepID=UPI0011428041|nr:MULTISPECIES: hypothetical protein [Myxococcus]NOK02951.1 hypothetical protein [Myxococcus xanthus]